MRWRIVAVVNVQGRGRRRGQILERVAQTCTPVRFATNAVPIWSAHQQRTSNKRSADARSADDIKRKRSPIEHALPQWHPLGRDAGTRHVNASFTFDLNTRQPAAANWLVVVGGTARLLSKHQLS